MLLLNTETMLSTGRGPPKNRKQRVVALNDKMAIPDDNLKAVTVLPERPAGESSMVVPFPGGQRYHAYECCCDACLSTLVTMWKEIHPDETMLPNKWPTKPVVPYV